VVFVGTMTLITVVSTAVISPSFRKLDLSKDLELHENEALLFIWLLKNSQSTSQALKS